MQQHWADTRSIEQILFFINWWGNYFNCSFYQNVVLLLSFRGACHWTVLLSENQIVWLMVRVLSLVFTKSSSRFSMYVWCSKQQKVVTQAIVCIVAICLKFNKSIMQSGVPRLILLIINSASHHPAKVPTRQSISHYLKFSYYHQYVLMDTRTKLITILWVWIFQIQLCL